MTPAFGGQYSIQLSYGCTATAIAAAAARRQTLNGVMLALWSLDRFDRGEFAEAATGAAARAGALDDDSDDVDIAKLVYRRLVTEGAFEAELGAAVGQYVAVPFSVAHDEIDGAVVADSGFADVSHLDAANGGAEDSRFGEWRRCGLGAGSQLAGGDGDRGCHDTHRQIPDWRPVKIRREAARYATFTT